jgi:hypothetical protein
MPATFAKAACLGFLAVVLMGAPSCASKVKPAKARAPVVAPAPRPVPKATTNPQTPSEAPPDEPAATDPDECPGGVCRVPEAPPCPFGPSLPDGEIADVGAGLSTASLRDPVTHRGPTQGISGMPAPAARIKAAGLADDSLPDWCRLAGIGALSLALLFAVVVVIRRLLTPRRPA